MSLLKNLLHHSRVSSVHSNDRVVDLFWFEQFICLDGFSKQLISIESISVQVHQFQISEMQKNCWANFYLLSSSASFCKFLFLWKDKLATNWNFKLTVNLNEAFCVTSWRNHSSFFVCYFLILIFFVFVFLVFFLTKSKQSFLEDDAK